MFLTHLASWVSCYGLCDCDEYSHLGHFFIYNVGHLLLSGDLGQTYDSNTTFEHYVKNSKGQAVLFVGDLSYADHYPLHDNVRWDTWGRFVEKSTAYQPWICTAGNHELDYAPEIVSPMHLKSMEFSQFTWLYI